MVADARRAAHRINHARYVTADERHSAGLSRGHLAGPQVAGTDDSTPGATTGILAAMLTDRPVRRPTLAFLFATLLLLLVACGDDDSTSPYTLTGEPDGPVVSIDIDDPGWFPATSGFQLETGDIPVRLTNARNEEVDVWVFLEPDGYETGDPLPDGVEPVIEESVPAGGEIQVTATFDRPGEYTVLLDPVTVGGFEPSGMPIKIVGD